MHMMSFAIQQLGQFLRLGRPHYIRPTLKAESELGDTFMVDGVLNSLCFQTLVMDLIEHVSFGASAILTSVCCSPGVFFEEKNIVLNKHTILNYFDEFFILKLT